MHSRTSGWSRVSVFTRSSATRLALGSDSHADTPSAATRMDATRRGRGRREVFTALQGYWQDVEMPLHLETRALLDVLAEMGTTPTEQQDPMTARAHRRAAPCSLRPTGGRCPWCGGQRCPSR